MYNITFSVLIKLNLIRIRTCVVNRVDLRFCCCVLWGFLGILFFFIYVIQHCFICHPSDSTASEDARIEPRTVTTLALTAGRSNHSARSYLWMCFTFEPTRSLRAVRTLNSTT
jgi:hypothetical protein